MKDEMRQHFGRTPSSRDEDEGLWNEDRVEHF